LGNGAFNNWQSLIYCKIVATNPLSL